MNDEFYKASPPLTVILGLIELQVLLAQSITNGHLWANIGVEDYLNDEFYKALPLTVILGLIELQVLLAQSITNGHLWANTGDDDYLNDEFYMASPPQTVILKFLT